MRADNAITDQDVFVVVAPMSSERPLHAGDATKLLFLGMLQYYRTAAQSGADTLLPKTFRRTYWDGLALTVFPDLDEDMRLADVFFALGWIWILMAVPKPSFDNPHRGFKEREYVVCRRGLGIQRPIGYIKVGFRNKGQTA